MKIKTSELTGAALDWAVAKAEEIDYACGISDIGAVLYYAENGEAHRYRPSTDWAEGGPIIEREMITVGPAQHEGWDASAWPVDPNAVMWGDIALEAAMRCFVMSKLGDEVEIPEELA